MNDTSAKQMKFEWDLPEDESVSALSADEIQLRKVLAEAFIRDPEHWQKDENGEPKKPYWLDHAIQLHEGSLRFPFRAAVLAAWLATPSKYRVPRTRKELADLLGLRSERQFTVWTAKNPQIMAVVNSVWNERALERLPDSMEAMFSVAATEDYKGRGDRELHFKLAGVLSDKLVLDKASNVDLSKLSFEEKLRLAGLDDPEALIKVRDELAKRRAEMEALSRSANEEEEQDVSADGDS